MVFRRGQARNGPASSSEGLAHGAVSAYSVPTHQPPAPTLHGLSISTALQGHGTAKLDAKIEVEVSSDVLFSLLHDPNNHVVIFKAIEAVHSKQIAENGPWRRFEVDCKARWNFWKLTGTIDSKMFVETDADKGTVSFKLREPGFLKVYEGTWVIKPHGHPTLNLYTRQQIRLGKAAPGTVGAPQPPPGSPRAPWSGLFRAMSSAVHRASWLASATAHHVHLPGHHPHLPHEQHTPAHPQGVLASVHDPVMSVHCSQSVLSSHALGSVPPSPPSSACSSPRHPLSSAWGTLDSQPPTLDILPRKSVIQMVDMRMRPKIPPPFPLGGMLKNQLSSQLHEMMEGLLGTAHRLHAGDVALCASLNLGHLTLDDVARPLDTNLAPSVGSCSSAGSSAIGSSMVSPRGAGSCCSSLSVREATAGVGGGSSGVSAGWNGSPWGEGGDMAGSMMAGQVAVNSHSIDVPVNLDD